MLRAIAKYHTDYVFGASLMEYPGYVIFPDGSVFSKFVGKIMKQWPMHAGYMQVRLRGRYAIKTFATQRLVLTVFRGNPPDGYQAAHLNGIRHDNRLENLAWITAKDNCAHKAQHGTAQRGEKHGGSKLTAADVAKIRELYRDGIATREIGKRFNITTEYVYQVGKGIVWRHLTAA